MKINWTLKGVCYSLDGVPECATITHIDGVSAKVIAASKRSRIFTNEEVREIRGLYNRKEMTGRALALQYNVFPYTIMSLIHKKTYKNV